MMCKGTVASAPHFIAAAAAADKGVKTPAIQKQHGLLAAVQTLMQLLDEQRAENGIEHGIEFQHQQSDEPKNDFHQHPQHAQGESRWKGLRHRERRGQHGAAGRRSQNHQKHQQHLFVLHQPLPEHRPVLEGDSGSLPCHDLYGRKIQPKANGQIYIQNGKKVLLRN